MAGMDDTGFTIKRLAEILSKFQADITAVLGEMNYDPDSVMGQMLGALAKSPTDIWERMQEVYYAPYVDSAEGLQLDSVVALHGMVRLAAQPTSVLGALWGSLGTTIPAGSKVSLTNSDDLFSLLADADIETVVSGTPVTVGGAIITVSNSVDGDTYSIAIDGTIYTYVNPTPGDPVATIAASLASDIDTGEANITGTSDGAEITLMATDGETSFELTIWQPGAPPLHFSNDSHAVFGTFEADEIGATLVIVGSLTEIETPVSGWTSVTNYVAGITGRATETDSELRIRRAASLALTGAATVEFIRASLLQNVTNVTAVNIIENRTDAVVGGVPAHAFECVIQGGADQDIGDHLWEIKPAGIAVHGTESVVVVDSQGENQTMKFSRPAEISFRLDVYITAYNTEQTFPTDGMTAIENAILAMIADLAVGEDVMPQSFMSAIYSVAGVGAVSLTWELGTGAGTPPHANAATVPITIADNEIAVATATEITVRDS